MSDVNKIHFAILDHKENYYGAEDIKPYIDIRMVHVNYTYDSGQEVSTKTYSGVQDCTDKNFESDPEFFKFFQKIKEEGEQIICL